MGGRSLIIPCISSDTEKEWQGRAPIWPERRSPASRATIPGGTVDPAAHCRPSAPIRPPKSILLSESPSQTSWTRDQASTLPPHEGSRNIPHKDFPRGQRFWGNLNNQYGMTIHPGFSTLSCFAESGAAVVVAVVVVATILFRQSAAVREISDNGAPLRISLMMWSTSDWEPIWMARKRFSKALR